MMTRMTGATAHSRKPLRILAAGFVILAAGAGALADDAIGSVRICDQRATPVAYEGPESAPAIPAGMVGTDASMPAVMGQDGAAPVESSGPVVYLSGNRLIDWYRLRQVEQSAGAQGGGPGPGVGSGPVADGDECPLCHRRRSHSLFGHGRFGHDDGTCEGDRMHTHMFTHHGVGCDDDGCGPGHGCLCGHCCLLGPEGGYGCRFLDCHCYHMAYPLDPWYFDRRDAQVFAAQGYGAPMSVPLAPNVTQQYNYGWGIPSSRITHISRIAEQPGALPGTVAPR